jgi:hypothetical protein
VLIQQKDVTAEQQHFGRSTTTLVLDVEAAVVVELLQLQAQVAQDNKHYTACLWYNNNA